MHRRQTGRSSEGKNNIDQELEELTHSEEIASLAKSEGRAAWKHRIYQMEKRSIIQDALIEGSIPQKQKSVRFSIALTLLSSDIQGLSDIQFE